MKRNAPMSEKPLQIRLEVTDQPRGQYTLSFDSSQYPVTLNPEASITFSEWLRRLRPVLSGGHDPAGDIDPQDLLRNVGIWLWQALLPENAQAQERETLAHALRTGRAPLLLDLPDMLAGLPWELLCDPDQVGERSFLARRRPLMRFSPSTTPMIPIELPLRVLLLISSPLSTPGHKFVPSSVALIQPNARRKVVWQTQSLERTYARLY